MKVFNCRHPARSPEEVTVKDCRECPYKPTDKGLSVEKVILRCSLCPGDALVLSAAIYSLHRAHPGRYQTAIETTADGLFDFNPDVWHAAPGDRNGVRTVQCEYPLVHQSNQRAIHFMEAYCSGLGDALGVQIPLLTNRPHLFVSFQEKQWMSQVQEATGRPTKFWVINSGFKPDYVAKWWGLSNYQRVVDLLRGKVQFVQIGSEEHDHPALSGVIDLRGKTDHRQFVRLCWHAEGGLGGVTFLQHAMAALERPYMCILGGREPVVWNSYPRQQLFHVVGSLPCCRSGGCWRSRIVKSGDGDEKDNSLCENPFFGVETVGKCMAMIRPEDVAEKILAYQA